jgi:hypothetical protein
VLLLCAAVLFGGVCLVMFGRRAAHDERREPVARAVATSPSVGIDHAAPEPGRSTGARMDLGEPASPSSESTGAGCVVVDGRALDAGGHGVEGVDIRVSVDGESVAGTALTAAGGGFFVRLEGLAPDEPVTMRVDGTAPGWFVLGATYRLLPSRCVTVRPELECTARSCAVRGTMLFEGGSPVAGGVVRVTGCPPRCETDAFGRFELRVPIWGDRIQITYSPDEARPLATRTIELACSVDQEAAAAIDGLELIAPSLLERCTLIVREESGAALPGARVSWLGWEPFLRTGADGSCEVWFDPGAPSALWVEMRGYGREVAHVRDVGPSQEVFVTMRRATLRRGIVVTETGAPVPDVLVEVRDGMGVASQGMAVADEQGRFQFQAPAGGEESLLFARGSDGSVGTGVYVEGMPSGESLVVLRPRGTLAGAVVTAQGQAVAGARVSAERVDQGEPDSAPALSDASGRFECPIARAGAYRLRISKPGFRTIEEDWNQGDPPPVVVLRESGFVSGRVVRRGGGAVQQFRARVLAEDRDGRLHPLSTWIWFVGDGRFSFEVSRLDIGADCAVVVEAGVLGETTEPTNVRAAEAFDVLVEI